MSFQKESFQHFYSFKEEVDAFKTLLCTLEMKEDEINRRKEFLSKISLKLSDFPSDFEIASIFENNIKKIGKMKGFGSLI